MGCSAGAAGRTGAAGWGARLKTGDMGGTGAPRGGTGVGAIGEWTGWMGGEAGAAARLKAGCPGMGTA
jgi:hypothetical protein